MLDWPASRRFCFPSARKKRSLSAGKLNLNAMTTLKDNWSRNEYQGKSRKQVEGSIYGFVVSAALLILVLLMLIIDKIL